MSTLYISNTDPSSSAGVWRVTDSIYQYLYTSFTPGQDVNLDQISIRTLAYDAGHSAPSNFQVGLYGAGVDSATPGSLITVLSGPVSPVDGAYNDYTPSETLTLESGSQYWLGFTLSSNTGDIAKRVKIAQNTGNFTTLGPGWSASSTKYQVSNGVANTYDRAFVYNLYGTSSAICFMAGTIILMANGLEKPIDQILIGDYIATSHGMQPVKWVAKRLIRSSAMNRDSYSQFLPVRIEEGALAECIPSRDLLVSGSHGLHVDGRIVNARFLVNDVNIYIDSVKQYPHFISYYHLEFDEEVFVLANNVKACSYVNRGNRRSFDNYPEFIKLYLNPEITASSCLSSYPRNQPSLIGHKCRTRRSWQAT